MSRFASLFTDLRTEAAAPQRADPLTGLRSRGLSEDQALAVLGAQASRIVVTACPGAGKTFTLVERAAWLLRNGVAAEDILLCTFTRAAAAELRRRIAQRAGGADTRRLACGTVHALALRQLGGTRALAALGVTLASDEQLEALAEVLQQELPEPLEGWTAQEVLLWLGHARESLEADALVQLAVNQWQTMLADRGLVDFTSLLELALANPAPRRYRHVLVDEAQDLTAIQMHWLEALCDARSTLYLVGDDDQSLYGFRGCSSGLLAEQVSDGAHHFSLQHNYRSDRAIVALANCLIAYNKGRLDQKMVAVSRSAGTVEVPMFETDRDEVAQALKWAEGRTRFRVLGRTRALLAPFEAAGLPVSTIHESKGLQWAHVWVTGLESGQLPNPRSERDDERRVLYVALTRAEHSLVLASARQRVLHERTLNLKPSPFLLELQGLGA